jgi:hypothetical protein
MNPFSALINTPKLLSSPIFSLKRPFFPPETKKSGRIILPLLVLLRILLLSIRASAHASSLFSSHQAEILPYGLPFSKKIHHAFSRLSYASHKSSFKPLEIR